jgi:D-alanyl-D-alanine dipeptidase
MSFNQTMEIRSLRLHLCLLAGMASALVLMDAKGGDSLVDIRSVDPTITVELRYAGRHNLLRQSLYPHGTRALARPEVASALARAQAFLRRCQYGLKIWDAYRPVAVQAKLWEASHNRDYVANPEIGVGSLHSWGIAVDATLVDSWNRDVRMPTDFDDFTPAAMSTYMGLSFERGGHVRLLNFAEAREIEGHVHLLKYAMHKAGFCGLRTEWWHFTLIDWQKYVPPEKAKSAAQVLETHSEGTL